MEKVARDTEFKPSLSKSETKAEATSRAALAIIDQEVADREAKTARLREARLAKEADERRSTPAAKPVRRVAKRA